MLVHVGTFHLVIASRLIGDLRRIRSSLGPRAVHSHLEDIMPVRTKVESHAILINKQISVNGIIGLIRVRLDADGAMISPCSLIHIR